MDHFNYQHGRLFAEQVDILEHIPVWGSPCYIYSRATLERHWRAYDKALGERRHLICYAVKANSNLAVLNVLAQLGSGFDIVSIGEMHRVLKAGGRADKIVFSGVGKRAAEIEEALLAGIRCFNIESEAELDVIAAIAASNGTTANISIRVNPDVDANTHPYISTGLKDNKFGIAIEQAYAVYQRAAENAALQVVGIDCHIGSQLTEVAPFVDALDRVLALVDRLAEAGIVLQHIDLGGGLGITYRDEQPPQPADLAQALSQKLADRDLEVMIEPGRSIAGNAGILVTQVLYLKHSEHKNFAVVDAAMNDLMRPSLYSAWMDIIPLAKGHNAEPRCYDVVGPVCETGDFLGKERMLDLSQGDYLAVRSAGAYGFSMSSNYNSRPRVAEIMVDGSDAVVVRERENIDSLMLGETTL